MSGRLLSLDAFRGFTIAAMLLVNNPGSLTATWEQSPYNLPTNIADLIAVDLATP